MASGAHRTRRVGACPRGGGQVVQRRDPSAPCRRPGALRTPAPRAAAGPIGRGRSARRADLGGPTGEPACGTTGRAPAADRRHRPRGRCGRDARRRAYRLAVLDLPRPAPARPRLDARAARRRSRAALARARVADGAVARGGLHADQPPADDRWRPVPGAPERLVPRRPAVPPAQPRGRGGDGGAPHRAHPRQHRARGVPARRPARRWTAARRPPRHDLAHQLRPTARLGPAPDRARRWGRGRRGARPSRGRGPQVRARRVRIRRRARDRAARRPPSR